MCCNYRDNVYTRKLNHKINTSTSLRNKKKSPEDGHVGIVTRVKVVYCVRTNIFA